MLEASDIFEHEWYPLFDGIGRSLLTAGRAFPVIGLFSGALEDIWRGANDVYTALQIGGAWGTGLAIATVLRNGVALINDATGHIKYVAQMVQDACVGIPGAQVVLPFTAAIIEICAAFKIPCQITIGLMDLGITITSFAHAASLEPGSTEHTNAMKLGTAYAVRLGVDVINGILDIFDVATAGAAQGGILQNAANFIGGLVRAAKNAHPLIRPIISKIITIWVPKIIKWASGDAEITQTSQEPNIGEAPAEEAKTVIGTGLSLWSALQGGVTELFGYGLEKWEEVKAKIEQELMEFAGGEEGFENLKTSMADSIDEMAARAADLLEIQTLASQAEEMTTEWNAEVESLMASLEALQIPEIPQPEPADYGDSWLSNAAEWVSDQAQSAAHFVASALQDTLQTIFDEGKEGLNAMIEPLIADIAGVTEFAQNVQDVANEQVAELEAQINDFTEKLRECEGFGDIFTLIIDTVWDAVFGEEEATQPEEEAQEWDNTCAETEAAQEEVESL